MARQVQSVSKFLFIFLVAISCTNRKTAAVPEMHVLISDTSLKQQQGFLYRSGQLFSGYTFALGDRGDTAAITAYMNGKEEGRSRRWHADGHLMEERFYVQGKKEGTHRGWWPGGTLKFEYSFLDGEHHGPSKEWFANGNIARNFNYVGGHEDGRQQMWWEDGTVRANYIVKEGEQFGLIGRKLCVSGK